MPRGAAEVAAIGIVHKRVAAALGLAVREALGHACRVVRIAPTAPVAPPDRRTPSTAEDRSSRALAVPVSRESAHAAAERRAQYEREPRRASARLRVGGEQLCIVGSPVSRRLPLKLFALRVELLRVACLRCFALLPLPLQLQRQPALLLLESSIDCLLLLLRSQPLLLRSLLLLLRVLVLLFHHRLSACQLPTQLHNLRTRRLDCLLRLDRLLLVGGMRCGLHRCLRLELLVHRSLLGEQFSQPFTLETLRVRLLLRPLRRLTRVG